MDVQLWTKVEEKWAYILVLRGAEVHRLKVTGNILTLKRKLGAVLEALQQGQEPANAGAKAVETLDVRAISKAEVSPGQTSLTLHSDADGGKRLTYSSGDDQAGEILQAILARTDRTFQPAQEEIGLVEALLPPVIVAVLGGLFWAGVYQSAGKLAAGEDVEVKGVRRRGLQKILISVAEVLGTTGTVVVGVILLVLVLVWTGKQIIQRPERTVWLPEPV